MVHAWTLAAAGFCGGVALLSLVRGAAGLLVSERLIRKLEAFWLVAAGLVGVIGAFLVVRLAL